MPVCRQAGRDFILLCKKLDLFSGELVAIDGSKFKALNSKKRNFNQQKLKKKIKEIEEKIEDYFKDLEENDVKELSCSPRYCEICQYLVAMQTGFAVSATVQT